MQSFLARHASKIKGVLSGFDRIRFRGTLRWLANTHGMRNWLWHRNVLFKDFKPFALSLTEQLRNESERIAKAAGCPMPYLYSSAVSKEERAQQIARTRGVREGLVCVFRCVEPCRTFEVGPNGRTKHLELRSFWGKCLHHYFYYIHPQWGWMHLRLQTWLPFTIHVGINGRDWLAGQLRQAEIPFLQKENCFVDVGDFARTQELLNAQLRTRWDEALNDLRRLCHPAHERMFGADLPIITGRLTTLNGRPTSCSVREPTWRRSIRSWFGMGSPPLAAVTCCASSAGAPASSTFMPRRSAAI